MICHTKAQWATLPLLLLGLTPTGVPAAQESPPVVTIEPPCPVLPRATPGQAKKESKPVEVRITYNPSAPGARLRSPQTLRLDLGINASYYADKHRSILLSRSDDDTWSSTIEVQPYWHYVIFYVEDDRNYVDDNHGHYWEFLVCNKRGIPTFSALRHQAESYAGNRVIRAIQRPHDYERAIRILEDALTRYPDRFEFLPLIWEYKIQEEDRSDTAFEAVAAEISAFLDERRNNLRALEAVSRFILSYEQLDAELEQKLVRYVAQFDPKSNVVAAAAYKAAVQKQSAPDRAAALEDLVHRFPESSKAQSALTEWFATEAQQEDNTEAVERAYEAWAAYDPENPYPPTSLGRFYLERGITLERAVELFDHALAIFARGPSIREGTTKLFFNPQHKEKEIAKLHFWRGRAQLQRGREDAAIDDFKSASTVLKDDPNIFLSLGEAYERLEQPKQAVLAYLEAATAPYQSGPEATEALERVFVSGGRGSKDEMDREILARIEERRKQAGDNYTPRFLNRFVPEFEFTTLSGETFQRTDVRGRLAVLNFWAVWCKPCIVELAALVKLQERNPQALVVAIEPYSEPDVVQAAVEKHGLHGLRVAASSKTGKAFGVNSFPITFVLDGAGKIRFVHSGIPSDLVAVLEKDFALLAGEAME